MSIPLVTLLPYSRTVVGSHFYHQRGGKGSGYSGTSQNKLDNIPDSDGFEVYLQGPQGNRSDTISTAKSDKNNKKRHKLGAYKSR